MTWFDQESIWRDKELWRNMSIGLGLVALLGIGMYYGLLKPQEEHWAKIDAEMKQKTQAELTSINNMNCQQLHDKLLSTDHFYDSDNEAIARDHYVAQCGVRLP